LRGDRSDQMSGNVPVDPKLKNIDQELVKLVFGEYECNIDLVGIHLRAIFSAGSCSSHPTSTSFRMRRECSSTASWNTYVPCG
jgi:hypothetical protein